MIPERAFKYALRQKLLKMFAGFYQEEKGNRVTVNNVEGFGARVLKMVDEEPWPTEGVDDGSKKKDNREGQSYKEAGSY